jgi:lysophospholipase L1-like esterase
VRAKGRSIPYADAMDKSKGAHIHVTTHRYYAEAIELLQRVGTKVIILGSPQARQLDWYHDDKHTYAEYLGEMKKLSDTYGVPFIDMNDPPVITNADFVDGDHLSDPGAEIFSKYLADELAKYVP